MKNNLFREKALNKGFSPEQINDYIKTTRPGVWIILSAIVILLCGILVWSVFGKVEMMIHSVTVCENGKSYCYISEKDIDRLDDNTYVRIEDSQYKLNDISDLPLHASEQISPYGLHLADFEKDEWVYRAETETTLKDGIYKTYVISERVSPVSLLWN